MLQHVERIDGIEGSWEGPITEVMDPKIECPGGRQPQSGILDENWVEIGRRQRLHLLAHDASAESIATPNLKNMLPPGKHLGDELIPRKRENEMLWIFAPALAAHRSKPLPPAGGDVIHANFVL